MGDGDPLVLTFDPQTVDHLGAKMYSHLPNAIAELIANAYDADANNVEVTLIAGGALSVSDDGHGMSREDVAEKYLHIGRNRRQGNGSSLTESGKRAVSGKKGLGKLALFGIGKNIRLATKRAGIDNKTVVELSYDKMMAAKGNYLPTETTERALNEERGTSVSLTDLKRVSAIDPFELAKSLSRLFNYADTSFRVRVVGEDGTTYSVTPELRLDAVEAEFEWMFPQSWTDGDVDELGREHAISGRVIASKVPLRQGMRGITLYVNGRLANEPEFFGASESSFAYSYLTGYLALDYLDAIEPDVIATDRRAIDWDTEETRLLRRQLQALMARIGQEWRARRAELRKKQQEEQIGGSTAEWVSSIRAKEQQPVRELVSAIESEDIDMTSAQQGTLLGLVKEVAPPYAEFVWRHLHPEIQSATSSYYIDQDYYIAVQEAIKRYVSLSKKRAGVDASDALTIVTSAFGEKGKLRVFHMYMASDGFDPQTEKNVENGQKHISMGIIGGFRNPLAHEEVARLQESGAFTNDDCLDALSIISHLMRRLDGAQDAIQGQDRQQ